MRQYFLATLLALSPAMALAAPSTQLHLTQSATITVQPDDFVVGFAAQADAATPALAQERVNQLSATVLAEARKVAGAKVATGTYGVWHQANPASWHANQSIIVHGASAAALLKLAGEAQARGVTVQQLGWRLSPAATRKADEEARDKALASLKSRAESAAAILGLHFAYFQEVTLGSPPTPIHPRVMMMAAAPAPGATAPVAATEGESVTQTVSAIAVLEP